MAIGVLGILVVILQARLDPLVKEMNKGVKTPMSGLSTEFVLGPLLGLQQAVAGALWARTDEFFHEGDYDAILPMVRMVTWMDPHFVDVYITGAWHLAYNFTDASERSDRRYIPAAQQLLREGDENNKEIYDIAFELGWQNSDKIKNYREAHKWFLEASKRHGPDQTGRATMPVPMFVRHQVAHALERQARVEEAVEVWRECFKESDEKLAKKPNDFTLRSTRDSEKHNLELLLKRNFSRTKHMIDWTVDRQQTREIDPQTGEPKPNNAYIETNPDDPNVGKPRPPSVIPPWDAAFETVRVQFPQPRVMDVAGVTTLGDGARIDVRLHDSDWREKQLTEFSFDIDQSQTIMQDQHSVRDARWGRKIDMSRDPKMYSFTRPSYFLILSYNPRATSPFLQDKFGWSGEGLTDLKYLWTDKSVDPPVRRLRKVIRLTPEHINGSKPVTAADVVSNDEYDRIQATPVPKK